MKAIRVKGRRSTIVAFFVGLVAIYTPLPALAQETGWYFPMADYAKRITVKSFGTLVDEAFYKGKEALFPFNRFSGYHAGVDLEVLPDDPERVPVYAVAKGKITYIGTLSGYGGIILLALAGEDHTALYGHVKITGLRLKTGDVVPAGDVLTYLGDAFSKETSKERKHLHFGIYKGVDRYFRGHEPSWASLISKWMEPTEYLEKNGAYHLPKPITPSSPPPVLKETQQTKPGILYTFIQKMRSFIVRFVQ